MRCTACKTDLPEFYKKCPLCGKEASDIPPLIPDIRTAEYPVVSTQPYKRSMFPVFLLIWLLTAVTGALLFFTQVITVKVFATLVTLIPLVWTLAGRPVFVRQHFVGNYVVINLYTLTLSAVAYGIATEADKSFYATALPVVAAAVCIILMLVVMLADIKSIHKAAPYTVLFFIYCITGAAVTYAVTKIIPFMWLLPVLCAAVLLMTALSKNKTKATEEIKAKFSIQ